MWPTHINPTVFWQRFRWPRLEFCLSSNYGRRKFCVTVGFDFLCVPVAQMLNLASSSASTLRERKEAFFLCCWPGPSLGKDLVHQCTTKSTSLLLLQKMPAVSQHADVRCTNSHSDPEILLFCAFYSVDSYSFAARDPLCLWRKLQDKQNWSWKCENPVNNVESLKMAFLRKF